MERIIYLEGNHPVTFIHIPKNVPPALCPEAVSTKLPKEFSGLDLRALLLIFQVSETLIKPS